MKKELHPDYVDCTVHCSCGNTFQTRSTKPELHIELCNKCHPFFTGQQKFVDAGGRVQRFTDKFGSATEQVAKREAARKAERQAAVAKAAEDAAKLRERKAAEKAERAAKYAEKAARDAEKTAAEQAVAESAEEAAAPAEAAAAEAPETAAE